MKKKVWNAIHVLQLLQMDYIHISIGIQVLIYGIKYDLFLYNIWIINSMSKKINIVIINQGLWNSLYMEQGTNDKK